MPRPACLSVLLACVLTLGLASCSPGAPAPAEKSAEPAGKASPPAPLPDKSLTVAEYIKMGMPAPSKGWLHDDMTRAAKVIEDLASQNPGALPRCGSSRSGAMFARMVAKENFGVCRDTSLPLSDRINMAVEFTQGISRIFKAYYGGYRQGGPGALELIEMQGACLRVSVAMAEVFDEFIPTIKRDDPKYAVRMQGLEKMKDGFAKQASGALITLTEKNVYRTSDLVRLAKIMQETFPPLLAHLAEDVQAEIRTRVETMAKDAANKDIAEELNKLLAAISETPKAKP